MKKKILSCLFCITFVMAQISYAADSFTDYDFSDEAQAEFERQYMNSGMFTSPQHQMLIKQDKHIIKENINNQTEKPLEVEFKPQKYIIPEIEVPENIKSVHQGHIITIPEGNVLNVKLQSGVSSGSLDVNDQITAALYKSWEYQGHVIAPAGSIAYGLVTNVDQAGYAYGSGKLEITFNKITTPEGITYDISAKPVSIESESLRGKNMARDVLIGAGIGLLTGILGSAFSGGENWGKNMAVFGGIGAATGALRGSMQRGLDANIQADTPLELILTKPVNASVYQSL